jgi:hypothetical protein
MSCVRVRVLMNEPQSIGLNTNHLQQHPQFECLICYSIIHNLIDNTHTCIESSTYVLAVEDDVVVDGSVCSAIARCCMSSCCGICGAIL